MEDRKKIKVLLINNGYPSASCPNYCTYIESIHECLNEAGFDVELLVIKYSKINLFVKIVNYILFWKKILFIDLSHYDLIYLNHPPYAFPVFFNKTFLLKKLYCHWHGNELISKNIIIAMIRRAFKEKFIKAIHIVPSDYYKKKLICSFKENRMRVLISPSGGVDVQLFNDENRIINSVFNVAFASSLTFDKGADLFMEIVRCKKYIENQSACHLCFTVIDYGKDSDYFKIKLLELDPTLCIVHKCPKDKMPLFYKSVDLLLMPSIREGESLGLVALEAMSCNIPVIAYDICAFNEFIHSGISGELVELLPDKEKSIQGFTNAIIEIIRHYNSYIPREIVLKKYSKQVVVDFYKSLLY